MDDTDDINIERDGAEEDGMSEVDLEQLESSLDAKLKKLRKELEDSKQESKEHLDGWQRAKADYVNALKRFDEEKADAIKLGSLKAARNFITAMDTLARAEAHGEIPESFQAIAKQLHVAADSLGLVQFGVVGEAFDPMLHEALGQDAGARRLADAADAREGVQLRAARWAFDDRDAVAAMQWLDQVPHGAARRTLALRLRFRAEDRTLKHGEVDVQMRQVMEILQSRFNAEIRS